MTTPGYGHRPTFHGDAAGGALGSIGGFRVCFPDGNLPADVTNALERERTVATFFYHQAQQGAYAAGFLIHTSGAADSGGLENVFTTAVRDLQSLLESHIEHPSTWDICEHPDAGP